MSQEPQELTERPLEPEFSNDNKRRKSSEPVESQAESQQSNASIDEEFSCGICLDALTTPYTVIPCLHTFDKSCLMGWWKMNNTCPTCKMVSTSAKSAFQLKAIMDHVHKNRRKRRRLSESTSLDEIHPSGDPVEDEDDLDSDDQESQESQESQVIPPGGGLIWPCVACIPNNHTGYTCPTPLQAPTREEIQAVEALHPDWAPITAPLRGQSRISLQSAIENGVPGASEHSLCVRCNAYVPLGFPRAIKCGGCADVFCHNLEPAGCPGPFADRLTFVARNDIKLTPHDISTLKLFFPPLVMHNRHEMIRFADYIAARDLSLEDILKELFEAKRKQAAEDTNEDAANEHWGADAWFCSRCVNFVVSSMLFEWWANERKASLDRQDGVIISAKPDCWYGRECRTQTHNDSHAERMNHICENTRARG